MTLVVFGVFVSLVVLLLMATAVAVTAAAAETVRGSISIPTQTFVATTADGTHTRPRGGRMSPSSGHTFSTGIIFQSTIQGSRGRRRGSGEGHQIGIARAAALLDRIRCCSRGPQLVLGCGHGGEGHQIGIARASSALLLVILRSRNQQRILLLIRGSEHRRVGCCGCCCRHRRR